MKVAVSIIKSKLSEKETVDLINQTSADSLHIDIMDGKFVENKTYCFEDIKLILRNNHKPIDIHLMCENPLDYIKQYIELKPQIIFFHIETVPNPLELIDYLHKNSIKCGIAINPQTSIDAIKPYLNNLDVVLVMTVHPGKGGQTFMIEMVDKIKELSLINGNFEIEIDGGVNNESIKYLENADIVVAGSYICMSDNYEEKIISLR